jgi:phosphate-selective porin OprO/OprP
VGGVPNRENNGARDLSSGIYFRRARFGVEGLVARDFSYRFVAEFGGSGTELQGRINDAYVAYTGLAPFTLQIGAFSPPANLDDGTPADETLFIERATPNELSRSFGGADGRIGLGARGNGTRWMAALTLTSRTVTDPEVFDAQSAVVARAGFLAMTSANYNLHVGASGTYIIHPADQGIDAAGVRTGVRLRDRPELRVDSTRLIDTGSIDASHAYLLGAELAGNWRSFFVQAENYWISVDRLSPAVTDPTFGGYYVQASWIATGESHRYNMANAAYQAPRPFKPFSSGGGSGAWEFAARFSHMDLNFAAGAAGSAPTPSSIRGGMQDIWTFGINWYATPNVRFVLDYQLVDVDRLNPAGPGNAAPFGPPPATPPVGVQIGQSYNAVSLRSQFSF